MAGTKEVKPCAECGTTEGPIRAGRARPKRVSGAKYGISGVLCEACYARRNVKAWTHARIIANLPRKAAVSPPPAAVVAPKIEAPAPDSIPYRERIRLDARHLSLVIQGRVAS